MILTRQMLLELALAVIQEQPRAEAGGGAPGARRTDLVVRVQPVWRGELGEGANLDAVQITLRSET